MNEVIKTFRKIAGIGKMRIVEWYGLQLILA